MSAMTSRRGFLAATGTASLAVVLTGHHASALSAAQGAPAPIDTKELIDPWIELDLDNLASNVREVRKRIGTLPIMAVVKCNAYGHGALAIAQALQRQSGVGHFMVVKTREALELRRAGITGMILNAGVFTTADVAQLLDADISQAVFSDAVAALAAGARGAGKIAKVHIYVDTGMGRVGVPYRDAPAFIERVARMPELRIEAVFTDMTEDDDYNPVQIERLTRIYDVARQRGINLGIRHTASSAEVDRYPYAWLDMVRPGNCLFGMEPERQVNVAVKPVMTFKTRIALVKAMVPGESLSYHRAYRIESNMRIATLPCGYSDGYPPEVANKGAVLIRGRRCPLVGPITANHMMVDVTAVADAAIGDEVVLWGAQGNERITPVELEGRSAGATNTYRMPTRTPPYMPRFTRG